MNALQLVALFFGILCLFSGLWALQFPTTAQRFCREIPRNQMVGRILILIDLVWALFLLRKMKLGNWEFIKPIVYSLSIFIYWFIIRYVNHYLGARSIALFLILLAKPILSICFLRDEASRLVITSLVYLQIIIGICFTVAPHWMRDMIRFWQASPTRWSFGCQTKMFVGVILISLGIFVY